MLSHNIIRHKKALEELFVCFYLKMDRFSLKQFSGLVLNARREEWFKALPLAIVSLGLWSLVM